jgi:hypothetical protein
MTTFGKYPHERGKQIPAEVFACLISGERRIILFPRVGLVDGGIPGDVPIELIPFELRVPNTSLWVQMDEYMNEVLCIWRREN